MEGSRFRFESSGPGCSFVKSAPSFTRKQAPFPLGLKLIHTVGSTLGGETDNHDPDNHDLGAATTTSFIKRRCAVARFVFV